MRDHATSLQLSVVLPDGHSEAGEEVPAVGDDGALSLVFRNLYNFIDRGFRTQIVQLT